MLLASFATQAAVERSQLTSDVQQREPVDNLQQQVIGSSGETSKVFYFTHVKDMAGKQIEHRWLFNGDPVAVVPLSIGSDSWRTYSSKLIVPEWQGDWQVQVWSGDQQLESHDFTFVVE